MEDKMAELFQQLLEDGYTVEQAADMAYNEFNKQKMFYVLRYYQSLAEIGFNKVFKNLD